MKDMGDMLLAEGPFTELVMGNTALVRAMVEAGTQVITSYPGSPTPEIAQAIKSIPGPRRPFYFEFSTNEKVATEVAFGAAVNGHLSTVFFKSVGLNVASDAVVQLSLMNIIGGMVIVLGDDPGANSSQNEQDNRHLAHLGYIPVFEPAGPAEVYRFYLTAARVARERAMPVIVRLTTHVCHAKEKVAFGRWEGQAADRSPRFNAENGPYIPLTTTALDQKRRALVNLTAVAELAEVSELNHVVDNHNGKRGVITMGLPFLSLLDVLEGVQNPPDILKLGLVYPLPQKAIRDFLAAHEEVKVLEELDRQLELETKSIAHDAGLPVKVIGKTQIEDWLGEYTPDKVYAVMQQTWGDLLPARPPIPEGLSQVPDRPAQLCPGCGHRSAFHAIKKALSENDITVADIGCHTLGYLPPYNLGQLLLCMGASPGMGAGLRLFNTTRKVLVFLGDSTFFHAGLPGIINAVFNHHPITLVVMENGTTAMTGHQDNPGSGRNFNTPTDRISIRRVLEALNIQHIYEVDTYQQSQSTEMVQKALAHDALSVVIARHPCMLKFTRERRRKPDYKPHRVAIDQDRCRQIYTCVERFACPSFTRMSDGHVEVNTDLCIGDGSCLQTCPAGAITKPKPRIKEGQP